MNTIPPVEVDIEIDASVHLRGFLYTPEQVAQHAIDWFEKYLPTSAARVATTANPVGESRQ